MSDFRNNEERPSITTICNDKLLGSRFIFSKFWAILQKMFDQVKLIKRQEEHARSHWRIKQLADVDRTGQIYDITPNIGNRPKLIFR